MSQPYLASMGAASSWNGRAVEWSFMDGPPQTSAPPFSSV